MDLDLLIAGGWEYLVRTPDVRDSGLRALAIYGDQTLMSAESR